MAKDLPQLVPFLRNGLDHLLKSFIVSDGVRDDILDDLIAAPNDCNILDAANNVLDDPLEGLAHAAVLKTLFAASSVMERDLLVMMCLKIHPK